MQMNIIVTHVMVYTSVRSCDQIVAIFTTPDTTTGVKLKADPHFAGTYFNLRVRHSFGPEGHCITVVEMAKDSFMKETKQTLEKSS